MGSPLSGQVALVTGAGSGIGQACARALAAAGADVGLLGRSVVRQADTARLVSAAGAAACVVAADVGSASAVREAVDAVLARFGRIDVLVNAAGTNSANRSFELTDPLEWERIVATNLTGVFHVTQAVLPTMRARGAGTIVNISSQAGKGAVAMAGVAYNASKMGVTALTQMVNLEERQHNIRATTIFPGATLTPLLLRRPVPVPAEDRARLLQPEDIGATVVFIATRPPRVLIEEIVMRPVAS